MSGGEAVFILQSDHGSQLGMDPFDAAKADVPERFGLFGLDLPGLEDRAWFSIGDLDFTEVTDRLRQR